MESHHRSFPLFRPPFNLPSLPFGHFLARKDIPHAMPLDDPTLQFCKYSVCDLTPPYSFGTPVQLSTLLLSCRQICKTLLADHCPQPEVAGSGSQFVLFWSFCVFLVFFLCSSFIPQINTAFEFFLVGADIGARSL